MKLKRTGRGLLLALLLLLLVGCARAAAPRRQASEQYLVAPREEAAAENAAPRKQAAVSSSSSSSQSSSSRPAAESGRQNRRGRQPDAQLPPVVPTSLETTSTFGLDADDASWRRSLALARQGYILEPDDVRVEEWLNALRWDYPQPEGEETFNLELTITTDPLDPDTWLALMGLSAAAPPEQPPSRHIAVVLDASGSMGEDNKLYTARTLVEALIDNLGENDRISLVQFSSLVLGEYTVRHAAADDPALEDSLRSFRPNQSTNAQAGLRAGYELALEARRLDEDALHYVFFISDGVANVGDTRAEAIIDSLGGQRAEANPIRLVAVGVGIQNYNDDLLEQVSNDGDGWYRYVYSPEEAQGLMSADSFAQLFSPAADEARAQVSWDASTVEEWRLVGYLNRAASNESFEDDTEDFAELHVGQENTVVYRLKPRADAEGPLGTLALRWHHPGSGEPQTQEWALATEFTPWEDVAPTRRLALLVALAGENSAERLEDAQGRRGTLEQEFSMLGDVTDTRQGQEFSEILAASLPEPPVWFEQGQSTRDE
jgi:Ca-activated chloride channel family protein